MRIRHLIVQFPINGFLADLDKNSGGLWHITHDDGANAYETASKEGKTLGIRTSGTGTTSTNTPLLAVGNTKYNGKNPPKYLNAEFNWFKIKVGDGSWINVFNGDTISVPRNQVIIAKSSIGNLQEATWLSPLNCKDKFGTVSLASTDNSELKIKEAILKETPLQRDANFKENFILTKGISSKTKVEIQMYAEERAWFGEKYRFVLKPID